MSLAQLPQNEANRLREIHASGDRDALRGYIRALRDRRWPLRAIGEPLGLSRSTIQFWETTGVPEENPSQEIVVSMSPRAIETAGDKLTRRRSEVLEEDKQRMNLLSFMAKQVRSQTPENSPLRRAANELDAKIEEYLKRMVPVTEIAKAMGVTHRAVKARMERYHAK